MLPGRLAALSRNALSTGGKRAVRPITPINPFNNRLSKRHMSPDMFSWTEKDTKFFIGLGCVTGAVIIGGTIKQMADASKKKDEEAAKAIRLNELIEKETRLEKIEKELAAAQKQRKIK
ncbi:MAG: hypothetical protein Hyperionvirus6_42 [Hyperionvirus sp.]|uniref:Uncharacterized protein n=1 Tax=Hyperionvirus sp. TaxID=2487770 RepID=A0A3G5AAU9_9VIRU|nr:MAG: hypothetical protein Hyperionvirus6_42 [Hyperionvirus sp.]